MKLLLAIALTSALSTSFAASVKPEVALSVDAQKTIHVTATNKTQYDTLCHYWVSRLVNTLSFKTDFGSVFLTSGQTVSIEVANNPADYIALPHARFSCN